MATKKASSLRLQGAVPTSRDDLGTGIKPLLWLWRGSSNEHESTRLRLTESYRVAHRYKRSRSYFWRRQVLNRPHCSPRLLEDVYSRRWLTMQGPTHDSSSLTILTQLAMSNTVLVMLWSCARRIKDLKILWEEICRAQTGSDPPAILLKPRIWSPLTPKDRQAMWRPMIHYHISEEQLCRYMGAAIEAKRQLRNRGRRHGDTCFSTALACSLWQDSAKLVQATEDIHHKFFQSRPGDRFHMPSIVIQTLLSQALTIVPGDLSELYSAIDRYLRRYFREPEARLLLSVFTPAHPKGRGRAVQFPGLALDLPDLESLLAKQTDPYGPKQTAPYEPSIQENKRKQVQRIRAKAPAYVDLIASAQGEIDTKIKALLEYHTYIFMGLLGPGDTEEKKKPKSRVEKKAKTEMCAAASLAVKYLNGLPTTSDVDDYYRSCALKDWADFLASDICQQERP